ncbi:MAG: DNA methyltransferase, partial [Nitrospiria bacterium]
MTTTSKKSIPPPARPVKPPEAGFNIPQANYPILENCYGQGWSGVVPETFLHPAKFSRALIRRIYDIALQRGWLRPGDWVLDPFGGVGLGAVDALFSGVNWVGVEIERRFVDIGAGCDCGGINKADWVRFYGRWGQASDRHWCPACLAQAGQVMDEYQPPLSHTQRARRARIVELAKKARRRINLVKPLPLPEIYKPIPKQGALFSRPDTGAAYVRGSYQIPTTDPHHYTGNLERFQRHARDGARAILLRGDSRKLGQVINQVAGVLGSPPYAGTNQNYRKGWQYIDRAKLPHSRSSRQQQADYGDEPGNVANLPDQGFDLTISSPVYGGNDKHDYTLDGRDQTGQGQG